MVFDARSCFSPRLGGSILLSVDFLAVLACLAVQLLAWIILGGERF